jgi:transposase
VKARYFPDRLDFVGSDEDDRAAITKLHAQGVSIRALAERFHVSYWAMHKRLKKWGLKTTNRKES